VFTTLAARRFLTASRDPDKQSLEHEAQDEPEVSAQDARLAVRNLHRLSLLTHDPNGGPRAVRMHALTQRATLERLGPSALGTAVRAAAESLTQAWPTVENDPPLSQVLRANAAALASHHPTALWDTGAHPLLLRAGRSLGETGLVSEAVAYFTDLADQASARLGPDHPRTLATRHNLARWRGLAGDPAGAATATAELLTDQLRVLGPDDPNTLITRGNLARLWGEAGDPARAATAYAELLTDQLRVLGPDHPATLINRGNLALWRGEAGDPTGAATATAELLTEQLRALGPDHPNTLTTRSNLARLRGEGGDPAGAAAAVAELLTDQLRVLGPDHPDTLITRSNLASWRGHAGDPAGAATALAELLTNQLRVLGPDHPDSLATRLILAYWRGAGRGPFRGRLTSLGRSL
jgi:Tetratricopeptide repeat